MFHATLPSCSFDVFPVVGPCIAFPVRVGLQDPTGVFVRPVRSDVVALLCLEVPIVANCIL